MKIVVVLTMTMVMFSKLLFVGTAVVMVVAMVVVTIKPGSHL